jgi:DNA polymerase-3 subunit epsilon
MAQSSRINPIGCGCLVLLLGPVLFNVLSQSIVPLFVAVVFLGIGLIAFLILRAKKVQASLDTLIQNAGEKAKVVVFDTETTGLYPEDGDRVIQIAFILLDENLEYVTDFSTLFNPSRDVGRTDIHGITQGMVRIAPRFGSMAEKFAKVLDGKVLVAHNADFDMRFLESEFFQSPFPTPKVKKVIDTLALARQHVRGPKNYKLMSLVEHFEIDTSNAPFGRAHDARFDAWCCAEILKRILDDTGIDRRKMTEN